LEYWSAGVLDTAFQELGIYIKVESRRQAVRLKTIRLLGKYEEAEKRGQESGETMKGLGSDYRPNSTPRAFLSGHLQSKQLQPDYVSNYKNL
jgi:hypothetical protein